MFCRALKGSVFRDCMKPIIDFIKRDDQPLNIYDDIYLQYQVEGVLCAYYNEVCKHEGRQSKQFPLQDLVTPGDCVAFLGLLVETGLLRPHLHRVRIRKKRLPSPQGGKLYSYDDRGGFYGYK